MECVLLNNGKKMPLLGYGVYQIKKEDTYRCVKEALEVGYRLIDTAAGYQNEEEVGKAIRDSGISREEIFVVTKIWVADFGDEKTKHALDKALKKLNIDYIDLVLLHQAFGDYYGAYRALEDYYKQGKIKAIGVSNFYPDRLLDLYMNMEIKKDDPRGSFVLTYVEIWERDIRNEQSPGLAFLTGKFHKKWAFGLGFIFREFSPPSDEDFPSIMIGKVK